MSRDLRRPGADDPAPRERDNDAYVRAVHDRGLAFHLSTMSRRRVIVLTGGDGRGERSPTRGHGRQNCLSGRGRVGGLGPLPRRRDERRDVRVEFGIVRSDIRSSFGGASGTAAGIPLAIALTVQDLACAPLAGAAVYLWHRNRDGSYSSYSTGITDQNYLGGIQETDASGTVTFTSIFPACWPGRWPHIHFEFYPSVADAVNGSGSGSGSGSGRIVKTSQIAVPEAAAHTVSRRAATAPASPPSPRSRWRRTTCSATTAPRESSGPSPGASRTVSRSA